MKLRASTIAMLERRRPKVLAELHPTLRMAVEKLLVDLGGIVTPWEGYRDQSAQERAFATGASAAHWRQSAHNYGPPEVAGALACDLVLHPGFVHVRPHPERPDIPWLWDRQSESSIKAWQALEDYCQLAGLERVKVRGSRDWPHVQLANWRSYLPG